MQDDERRRWCLLLDCEPPPGDGYHVCEVKVQGIILQLSDKQIFISGSFQFTEYINHQRWQKVP